MELLKNVYGRENAIEVADYPYGFRLRTTMYIWLERNKNGYRYCTSTLNPKNGKENAPKKTTYSTYMRLAKKDNGHITFYNYELYSVEGFYKAKDLNIFEEDFDLEGLANALRLLTIRGSVVYGGYDLDKIKDLTLDDLRILKNKEDEKDLEYINQFKTEEGKDPNYNPFKITSTCIIG